MVALGVILHALGGCAAGSFYIPFKKVINWAWESYWLVAGIFSWIITPILVGWLTVPDLYDILSNSPAKSLLWSYVFGVLWGVGGLTFGLSMRYLGMSLGYAISLGFCAVFGTLMIPIYYGEFTTIIRTTSGLTMISGVFVCLIGIAVCGWSGMQKDKALSDEQKKQTIHEFNFSKGILVAVFAGFMSACISFGIDAGKPIAEFAVIRGTAVLWQNSPVLIIVLLGGFTTNFVWTVILNIKNRTGKDYFFSRKAPLTSNYFFSALAGITWYLQFMFYGMGTTYMGRYDFSSWTIHMSFIIVFSNMWGIIFKEWKGVSRSTINTMITGLIVVLFSTILVGIGNYLAAAE